MVVGSIVLVGCNVMIVVVGVGKDSNIDVIGSMILVGNNVKLVVEGNVNL